VSITGAEQFEAVGLRLDAAAVELRAALEGALHAAAPTLVKGAVASARARLPKKGGLNDLVAADAFVVQDRSTILQAGIRIGTTSTNGRGSNHGVIRHPVFGHNDRWVAQPYEPAKGWFDDAMDEGRPAVEAAVAAALLAVSSTITKGG
jgi:hypothetical protein